MIFSTLRMLGLIRRGVRALESLAKSQATLSLLAEQREHRATSRLGRRRAPKPTELGVMDPIEVERRFQEQLKYDTVERG